MVWLVGVGASCGWDGGSRCEVLVGRHLLFQKNRQGGRANISRRRLLFPQTWNKRLFERQSIVLLSCCALSWMLSSDLYKW